MEPTEGTWKIQDNDIVNEFDEVVCTLGAYDDCFTAEELDEMEANAHLLRSSKELLEEAEKIYKMLYKYLTINTNINERWCNYFSVALGSLKETIKEAKGEGLEE